MKYICTAVDFNTRYLVMAPLHDGTSSQIAKFLVERIYFVFGAPHTIITDRGTAFCSELIHEINSLRGKKHNRTTAFNPLANGACERPHATIMDGIASYCNGQPKELDKFIPHIQFALNTEKRSIRRKPAFFNAYIFGQATY